MSMFDRDISEMPDRDVGLWKVDLVDTKYLSKFHMASNALSSIYLSEEDKEIADPESAYRPRALQLYEDQQGHLVKTASLEETEQTSTKQEFGPPIVNTTFEEEDSGISVSSPTIKEESSTANKMEKIQNTTKKSKAYGSANTVLGRFVDSNLNSYYNDKDGETCNEVKAKINFVTATGNDQMDGTFAGIEAEEVSTKENNVPDFEHQFVPLSEYIHAVEEEDEYLVNIKKLSKLLEDEQLDLEVHVGKICKYIVVRAKDDQDGTKNLTIQGFGRTKEMARIAARSELNKSIETIDGKEVTD